ncbi:MULTISPECIES: hypothetical protein [unclassified Serratia (in: enterobacteria)]|uniref:hypothetical protein n=1 Tax=unclassified Serratia (in: enterobacteria) TaxID=2647522 RepID=UPI003B43BD9C
MIKSVVLKLQPVSNNIVKVFSNGEVAGYVVLPENEHQNQRPFATTHNGKDIGYAHCEICVIETLIRRFERIAPDVALQLIPDPAQTVSINVLSIH